ncbi:MAG TPA: hypothetical protein VFO29_09090 [Candidatus Rubrimentiphilum sp.]|nr:hypothetical protein [Candidatus Rubrimentiphilum sp.]
MKQIVGLTLFCLLLSLAAPASAALIVPPNSELGHVLVLTDGVQVYVHTDAQSAIFSALLPSAWSYSILVDGDENGAWGDGPLGSRKLSHSQADFAYATARGKLCTQYIYAAYPDNPDMVYDSSVCGARKSRATFGLVAAADGVSLQTFTIPKSELRDGPGEVHFAIEVWDGSATSVFGSPSAPYVLTLVLTA